MVKDITTGPGSTGAIYFTQPISVLVSGSIVELQALYKTGGYLA